MAVILTDAWYPLGCGCELSELGGMLIRPRCRAHSILIPSFGEGGPTPGQRRRNDVYGPIDVDVPKLAGGGEARG